MRGRQTNNRDKNEIEGEAYDIKEGDEAQIREEEGALR